MRLGYNTNGFADHDLSGVLVILAEIGYHSVALTLERRQLDPPDRSGVPACVALIKPLIEASGLSVTIEAGSRFILDPHRKHQPTLISRSPDGRRRRIEFLQTVVEVAAALEADSVALWSGTPDDDAGETELFDRLTGGLNEVLDHAEARGVRLSFEPEPGMFIDTMARFEKLCTGVDHPLLGLTLDVGHVHCLNDGDIGAHIRQWRCVLWSVHIEDMRAGVHEHLMFGEGEMDFAAVFDALREVDYRGPVHVELPGDSHHAAETARRSHKVLQRYI